MKSAVALLLTGLIMAGCVAGVSAERPGRGKDPQMVVGRTWQWISTVTSAEKISAAEPARYTIFLQEDGNVRARFDCNKGGGGYTLTAGRLSFGPMMSTRMACPPDTQDAPFMRDLQRVASFFLEGGDLFLELSDDGGTMRFRQAPARADAFELKGTVVHMALAGGFFAIKGDDGKTYDPIDLPEAFRTNGMRVIITARVRNDVSSVHMVGEIIEILDIAAQ